MLELVEVGSISLSRTFVSLIILSLRAELGTDALSPYPRSEPILYSFTEIYFTRLEGPIAVQVWTTFITLAKDVVANNTNTISKNQVFPTLR